VTDHASVVGKPKLTVLQERVVESHVTLLSKPVFSSAGLIGRFPNAETPRIVPGSFPSLRDRRSDTADGF
jgi:hypothetical protein